MIWCLGRSLGKKNWKGKRIVGLGWLKQGTGRLDSGEGQWLLVRVSTLSNVEGAQMSMVPYW